MTGSPGDVGRLPDFIIAGAMRSGTTALYRYLGAHPEIFIATKELQFFTSGFGAGVDWYREQFSNHGDARVLGEATADYFARPTAMERIADILPDARLIASFRNPVDRAWSHYHLLRARGRDKRTFDAAIDDEMNAIAAGDTGRKVFYLFHSMYDDHLERAFELFDREQVHVSIFEQMVRDPAGTYRSLCRYLGVDDGFVPSNLGSPVNAYVQFRSLRVRQFSKRLPGPLERIVGRLNSVDRGALPDLDAASRARLTEYFTPRIQRVEDLLGYEIPDWHAAA